MVHSALKTSEIYHFDKLEACSLVSNFYPLIQRFFFGREGTNMLVITRPKARNIDNRIALDSSAIG